MNARVLNLTDMNAHLDAGQDLKKIARELNQHRGRIIVECFEVGRLMLEARKLIRANYTKGEHDGRWLMWLEDDVNISPKQAARFVQVYEKYGGGCDVATPLSKQKFSTLAELAAPNADPLKVQEIEKEIMAGKKVTVKEVRRRVKKTTDTEKHEGGDWTKEWVKNRRELFNADLREHPKRGEQVWMKKWQMSFIRREYGNK